MQSNICPLNCFESDWLLSMKIGGRRSTSFPCLQRIFSLTCVNTSTISNEASSQFLAISIDHYWRGLYLLHLFCNKKSEPVLPSLNPFQPVLALGPNPRKAFDILGVIRRDVAEEEGRRMMWILRRGEKTPLQHPGKVWELRSLFTVFAVVSPDTLQTCQSLEV